VTNRAEAEKVLAILPTKYPEQASLPIEMPKPEEVRIFRVTPTVISVLDYSKGFGNTDLVTCRGRLELSGGAVPYFSATGAGAPPHTYL
jgi:hypothetical protein